MKTKEFDCVEMKRRGAEKVYEITKDMSPAQELEFWRLRTEALRRTQTVVEPVAGTGKGVAGKT